MNFIFRATLLLGFTFCNIKNEPQFFITVQEKLKGFEIKKEYPFIKEYSFSDSAVYYKLKIQNNTDSNFYVKCRNFGNMVHFEKIVNFKQLPDGKLNQLSISIGSNMNESAKLIKSHDSIILFTEYIIT